MLLICVEVVAAGNVELISSQVMLVSKRLSLLSLFPQFDCGVITLTYSTQLGIVKQ